MICPDCGYHVCSGCPGVTCSKCGCILIEVKKKVSSKKEKLLEKIKKDYNLKEED